MTRLLTIIVLSFTASNHLLVGGKYIYIYFFFAKWQISNFGMKVFIFYLKSNYLWEFVISEHSAIII